MAYIINRFDGTQLTIVDDGVLDNTTPLGLIGRNYTGYGEVQNENFIFLLENFANQSPPTRSIRGQIWYDTVGKALKVYNGIDWLSIGNATVSETEPGHSSGGLWLKAITKQLYISDGTVWRLVGPEGVEGFSTTKLTSTKLRSSTGAFYPVILSEINGETIAILTNDTFIISSDNSILGFDQLNKGINLKADSSFTGSLKGNATTATRLETLRTINDVGFNGTSNIVITATTNQPLSPGDYIIGSEFSGAFADTWNIDASSENLIGKIVARDATGSFSATTITAGEFTGTLLGNVSSFSGTSTFDQIIVNDITGTTFSGLAARATRLSARKTINTVPFDGTEDIILPVPAETLTGNTLAPNIVNSSLTTLGKLEYLETEAPGIKVGDGNNLLFYIEGFTPTIESETTDILKLKLKTGSTSAAPTTVTFLSASAASADGITNPALVPDYTLSTDINNRPVLGLPSFRWRNIYSKEATLDSLKTTTISGRTTADQVTFTKDIIVTGTAYTSVVGNLTGSVTGASSLNVLKSGDTMTGDLIVGSVTKTSNSLISVRASDSHKAGFEAYGSNQGTGYLYIGQSTTYGGGVSYNGDNSPSFIPGENADYITFYRRNAGADVVVFEYPYNSNDVSFKGNVGAVTFSGNGINISNLNAANISSGLLPVARLSGTYNINVAGNVTGNLTGNVTGNLTGNVTGNLTGTVTGSSTLNVLKAGDTMTGDLTIQKANAWISLDSPSDGTEGTNQAAGISIGESGYKGSATLHMTYTGDGYSHIGMGPINGSTSLPQFEAIRLYYLDNTVRVLGNMTVAGTASGTFSGTGTSLDINAERLVIGNIPVGRLSGTYNISISGNSNYANTAGSASANIQRSGDTMTGRLGQHTTGFHAASIDNITTRTNSGFFDNPNPTTSNGWPVNGSWHHLLSSTHVNDANYYAMQFSADFYAQNLYYRSTAGNGSTAWNKILHSNNYNDYAPTKTGAGASGTWAINISGTAAAATSIPWTGVTGKPNVVVNDGGTYGINISGNSGSANILTGGVSDPYYLRYRGYVSGDAGTNSITGMGIYGVSMPGYSDTVIHFGTAGGSSPAIQLRANYGDSLWFRVARDSETNWDGVGSRDKLILHSGNYNSYSPTLTGGNASGTWGINITGNAATVTSLNSTQITNALGYVPVNPASLSNTAGTAIIGSTGSFSGKLSVAAGSDKGIHFPTDAYGGSGDTARITLESAGGEATRMRFTMTNDGDDYFEFSAPSNAGLKMNGYTVLHAANYNSYSPTLTGGNASGTWSINITGTAALASSVAWNNVTGKPAIVYNDGSTYSIGVTGNAGTATTSRFVQSPDGDRNPNTKLPTTTGQSVRFDFAQATYTGTGGNYAGVMTYAPWTGTTVSTGDASYQLAFGSTAINGGGTPQLRIRKGIDSTWNSWYDLLTTANYNSFVPTLTGTGASGTWPISVSGNAATVTTVSSAQIASGLGYTPVSRSGDNMSGELNLQDYNLKRATIIDYSLAHNALGNVSGGTTVNLELGNYASATSVGAVTWTFANPPTGARTGSLILELTNGGAYTQYWPASVRWPAGAAPSLSAAGVDVLVFITDDAGTNWRGAISMGDSR